MFSISFFSCSPCQTLGWRWIVQSDGSPCWWLEVQEEQRGTWQGQVLPGRTPAPPPPGASQTPSWAAPGSPRNLEKHNRCFENLKWKQNISYVFKSRTKKVNFPHINTNNLPTRTTVASAFSGIFSSSFSSCLDLDRCMPSPRAGSFCYKNTAI